MSKKPLLVLCLLLLSSALCAATYTVREASGLPDGASLIDVNNRGQAAALFTGADGRSHAARCTLQGEFADLGQGYGVDINESGQILVQSPTGCFLSNPDGTYIDLRAAVSGQSYPQRINDLGWVAGYVLVSTGRYRGFVWSAEAGTVLLTLPTGDATGFAMDVNNVGEVAGYSLNSGQSYARPFIWGSEIGLLPLPPAPDATYSMPFRMNDAGQVVGSGSGSVGYRSVLWNPDGAVIDLGPGEVADINNPGQVLMREYPLAYLLSSDGSRTDLPAPEGSMGVQAYGINDDGLAVGVVITGSGMIRAAVWEPVPDSVVAVIDLQPGTINLKSKGFVACFIELPSGGPAPEEIDITSLRLQGVAPARESGIIGDYDADGVPDLMVRFSREELRSALQPGYCTITLSGYTSGGRELTGEAVIRVIAGGK